MNRFTPHITSEESATASAHVASVPTVSVSLPTHCTAVALVRALSQAMGLSDDRPRSLADSTNRLTKSLSYTRVGLVVVDEFHHLLPRQGEATAAPTMQQEALRSLLSRLSDATGTHITVKDQLNTSAAAGIPVRELRSYWAAS